MSKFRQIIVATALAGTMSTATPALAGAEPFIGQVIFYPYNFCPRGWQSASGQILSIAQNTALFALLGTTYGGNGQTTFALPDLRGRAALGQGSGPGLTPRTIGEQSGTETHTLTIAEMPTHAHTALVTTVATNGDSTFPVRNSFAGAANSYAPGAPPITPPAALNAAATTVTNTGGNQPFAKRSPTLTLTPCIALEGIFPSRN